MEYQKFITATLEEASKIANDMFGKVSVSIKPHDPNQILTDADLKVGKFIIEEIEKEFPEHNIIDEEGGAIDKKSEYTWVTDPIDGTANFANGLPTYGIMIGLLKGNMPVAGGIALPADKEIYIAEKGMGTFHNGRKITIKDRDNFSTTLVAFCVDKHPEDPAMTVFESKILVELVNNFLNYRTNASVYDIIMLLNGGYGGCLYDMGYIWDSVAQQIVIEEAGGIYTDLFGSPIDYSKPLEKTKTNFSCCAAGPAIHKKLQQIVYKVKH